MKIYTIDPIPNNYPVGDHIMENKMYIDRVVPIIKKIIDRKDINVWCRGSSGAILATMLVLQLKNDSSIIHIKKEGESHHLPSNLMRTRRDGRMNLFIDDFSRTGETMNAIWIKAKNYIEYVDLLILSDNNLEWNFDFVPKHFITNHGCVRTEWKSLGIASKTVANEEDFISF